MLYRRPCRCRCPLRTCPRCRNGIGGARCAAAARTVAGAASLPVTSALASSAASPTKPARHSPSPSRVREHVQRRRSGRPGQPLREHQPQLGSLRRPTCGRLCDVRSGPLECRGEGAQHRRGGRRERGAHRRGPGHQGRRGHPPGGGGLELLEAPRTSMPLQL